MLLAENDLSRPPVDAVRRDPEVRQARKIADAARSALLACVGGPQDVVDLVRAQRMLDKLKEAQALAEDAEDLVMVHRGLLTPAEAEQRAAARRPTGSGRRDVQEPAGVAVSTRPAGIPGRYAEAGARVVRFTAGRLSALSPATRRVAGCVLLHTLIPAAAGFAGGAVARRRR